jgi:hypothetical protein
MGIKLTLIINIVLLNSACLFAQQLECGTITTESDMLQLKQFINSRPTTKSATTGIRYFPVQHHIVQPTGIGYILSPTDLAQIIEELNVAFVGANIQFYTCDAIDYIVSDTYFHLTYMGESGLYSIHNNPDAINVYYVAVITCGEDCSYAGYAYYPWQNINFIAISNGPATNGSTVIHEFGHFFGLLHTDETVYGKEYVDGSNCEIAGDLLCDTPADPKLSTCVNSDCEYTGTETDGHGDAYAPDTHNFMSYSRYDCRDEFSNQQMELMSDWADASQRQVFMQKTTLSGTTISLDRTITDDFVVIDNVTITNNSDVVISACQSVKIQNGFEAPVGSTLVITP